MAAIAINGSALGTSLQSLLMADEIVPGSDVSYQLCKTIYLYHPLGAKMAEAPVTMALSQAREISIPDGPEERVREQFEREWGALRVNDHIANTLNTSRIYGIGTIIVGAVDVPTDQPLDYWKLSDLQIYFNVLDPLTTAGSLVLNQDPNSPDFQKTVGVRVGGNNYHRSRSCVMMNEKPIYIAYTSSAFGYVGRSVYQRALFPLKTFVQTMVTDDMVTRKCGVLVAKMKAAGSIINSIMVSVGVLKRQMIKDAETDNVLGIGVDEDVQSLNLQNVEGAATMARKNILENIATAADMPAKLLNQETFSEGFGEGTEDAKAVVRYIDTYRQHIAPLYTYFDKIVQHRAWNKAFYETIQAEFPEYKDVPYETAFFKWSNSFSAKWPSLLAEPDSEKIKVDETKLKAIIDLVNTLKADMDPENKFVFSNGPPTTSTKTSCCLLRPSIWIGTRSRIHSARSTAARRLG